MKMTTVQQVTQVAFMPRLFPVNVYLVEEEDGLTLIDTGMPFSIKGIQQAAARLGKPIVRIVLTHAHGDHIGAFDLLKAALPQVTTYISRRDSRLLAGSKELEPGEPQEQVRGDIPAPGKVTTKPDVLLEDGDRIGSLLAVASPGTRRDIWRSTTRAAASLSRATPSRPARLWPYRAICSRCSLSRRWPPGARRPLSPAPNAWLV